MVTVVTEVTAGQGTGDGPAATSQQPVPTTWRLLGFLPVGPRHVDSALASVCGFTVTSRLLRYVPFGKVERLSLNKENTIQMPKERRGRGGFLDTGPVAL